MFDNLEDVAQQNYDLMFDTYFEECNPEVGDCSNCENEDCEHWGEFNG